MFDLQFSSRLTQDDRGVTWTIEAFLSVALLLAILFIAIQSIPAADQSDPRTDFQQTQLQQDGQDILSGAESTRQLHNGLLYWDVHNNEWHDPTNSLITSQGEYSAFPEQNPLHESFSLLSANQIAYNIDVRYQDSNNEPIDERETLVYQGVPSSSAVVVQQTIILNDDDVMIDEDGEQLEGECGASSGEEVTLDHVSNSGSCDYFMPRPNDFEEGTDRYNVVQLRLILWT